MRKNKMIRKEDNEMLPFKNGQQKRVCDCSKDGTEVIIARGSTKTRIRAENGAKLILENV